MSLQGLPQRLPTGGYNTNGPYIKTDVYPIAHANGSDGSSVVGELAPIHRAAHLASCKPDVICAKTVVDLAGGAKDDELHPYGCVISARFIAEVLEAYFNR